MKDDAPVPARPPKKRRQIEKALAQWLAVWAADESLTPSERRRAQDERDRRKGLDPDPELIGLLIGEQGVTPDQLLTVQRVAADALEVHATRSVKLGLDPGVFVRQDSMRDVVLAATRVIACPAQTYEPEQKVHGVWPEVRYARHRKIPVTVVWPDGSPNEGDSA